MIYDKSIDNIVIRELGTGRKHSNELLITINRDRKPTGKQILRHRTLNIHLNKMESEGIISRDNPQPAGHKRYCSLTNQTELEIQLGIYEGVHSKRNKKLLPEEEDKINLRRAILLLLSIASTGSTRFKHTSKSEPGDIVGVNPLMGHMETFSVVSIEGVSVQDITEHRVSDYRKELTYMDIGNANIEKLIHVLRSLEPPVLLIQDIHKDETRYRIKDEQLREFVFHCQEILFYIVEKMRLIWILQRKPKKDEKKWYVQLVGREKMRNFFLKYKDERKESINKEVLDFLAVRFKAVKSSNKKEIIAKSIEAIHDDLIRQWDAIILRQIESLQHESNELKTKYPTIAKIMYDFIYPKFIKKLLAVKI